MEQSRQRAWRQTAVVSVAAAAVFIGVRAIPIGGSNLHYTDFHSGGKSYLEFCEPGSPQFAPVDRVRSPVSLELTAGSPAVAGKLATFYLGLVTSSGKTISVDDLLVVHTEKLHLLIIGPGLDDYHHVHPQPVRGSEDFSFSFIPSQSGEYKVFADFMPRATGRSLYAGGEIDVLPGTAIPPLPGSSSEEEGRLVSRNGDLQFTLFMPDGGFRINQSSNIRLSIERVDHVPIELEEVMGAFAHLVAFDAERSGFAHLHPLLDTPNTPEGSAGVSGELAFSLYLTDPGRYRLWAQVKTDGVDRYAPFDLKVTP